MLTLLQNPLCESDQIKQSIVMTIGNFDGVHYGHQAILRQLQSRAQQEHAYTGVLIFEPQPLELFQGYDAPGRIMNLRQKVQTLFEYGVDCVFICKFRTYVSKMSPVEFIEQILERLANQGLTLQALVIGDDFHFGANKAGNKETLRTLGCTYGFQVENIDTISYDAQFNSQGCLKSRVSSSVIRQLIQNDQLVEAEKLLTRPYYLFDKIVYGQQLGRNMNVPTANFKIARGAPLLHGVFIGYAGINVGWQLSKLPAIANLGYRPSVNGQLYKVEVHCLKAKNSEAPISNDQLYGQRLCFVPIQKVRDEKKFESLADLRHAIENDLNFAKTYFNALEPGRL